jgi:hypothetical protein
MQNNNLAPPDPSPYLSQGEFNGGRVRSNSTRSQRSQQSTENADFTRRPSIRIRHVPSYQPPPNAGRNNGNENNLIEGQHVGRNRANSAPQELNHAPVQEEPNPPRLSFVIEEPNPPTSGILGRIPESNLPPVQENGQRPRIPSFARTRTRRLRRARTNIGAQSEEPSEGDNEYDQSLVDLLDLVGM